MDRMELETFRDTALSRAAMAGRMSKYQQERGDVHVAIHGQGNAAGIIAAVALLDSMATGLPMSECVPQAEREVARLWHEYTRHVPDDQVAAILDGSAHIDAVMDRARSGVYAVTQG